MGASAAVAVVIAKEKHLVSHMRRLGATSPTAAKTPADLGIEPRLAWERLVARAVVREARPGTYYLDEPTWEALRSVRRRVAIVCLILGLIVLAFAVLKSR